MALVTTTANGGEDRARPSRERVREMRGRVREEERGTWGSAWQPWTSPGRRQKQEVAGVWPRAPATRSSSSWREEDDDWQGQSAGPSQVGWASTGKAQVGFPLSLFLICFCFLFFLQLLGFIKNTKMFPKILKIIVGFV